MKKSWIALINLAITLTVLAFVILYARHEGQSSYDERLQNFANMTVAMERVTENYLEGEQNVCDVWARHIVASGLTLRVVPISRMAEKRSSRRRSTKTRDLR